MDAGRARQGPPLGPSPALAPPAHAAAPAASAPGPGERSFIMVKPDGVARGLVADVAARFEARGFKLVACRMLPPTAALAEAHYAEHKGKPFFPKLVTFLSSGPVLGMVWEGRGVIATSRAMIGATNPAAAATGTIRGERAIDTGRNVVHGSDSQSAAEREIALWFPRQGDVVDWARPGDEWVHEKEAA